MCDYLKIFSSRLKALHLAYHLSLVEMATILQLSKSNGASLYDWEKGRSFPGFERLIRIADIFCISVDWLIGRSDIIYTEKSVSLGEDALHRQIEHNSITEKNVSPEYQQAFCQELQKLTGNRSPEKLYSLAVRANLVVLLHMVPLADIYWAEAYLQNGRKKRGVLATTKSRLALLDQKMAESYKEPGKKAKERAINLVNLLQPAEKGIKSQPVYDVIAACESSHS